MQKTLSLCISIVALTLGAASAHAQAKWTCKADAPMVRGDYKEGDKEAYIHLEGFSRGANYAVTPSADGLSVTGVTANRTAFRCSKAS